MHFTVLILRLSLKHWLSHITAAYFVWQLGGDMSLSGFNQKPFMSL